MKAVALFIYSCVCEFRGWHLVASVIGMHVVKSSMKAVALFICSCVCEFRGWHLVARVIGMHVVKSGPPDLSAIMIPNHSGSGSLHWALHTTTPLWSVKIITCVGNWPNTDAMFERCGDAGDCCHGDWGFWFWGKNIGLTVLAFRRGPVESVCERKSRSRIDAKPL